MLFYLIKENITVLYARIIIIKKGHDQDNTLKYVIMVVTRGHMYESLGGTLADAHSEYNQYKKKFHMYPGVNSHSLVVPFICGMCDA